MTRNETVTLTIEGFGSEGEGVAKADGMAVFLPFALPGETVEAKIVSVKKTHAFARAERILTASPSRITPVCPHYARCGGCVCQHMAYETSLQYKRQAVADCMQRIAKSSFPVATPLGMAVPWHYRNKTASPVQAGQDGAMTGFYAPRSHRMVPVSHCPIAMPQSDIVNAAVLKWMNAFGIPAYDETSRSGLVRHIVTRVNRAGETMAMLVVHQKKLPRQRELIETLRACGANVTTVACSVNDRTDNTILGNTYTTLWGEGFLYETLLGVRFRLSPLSFFQVNPDQTEVLYQTAVRLADLKPGDILADVYCGAGTIGLCLAGAVRQVIGIEIVPQAIEDAAFNAALNGIGNAQFRLGRAEDVLPALLQDGFRPNAVVLDPPRKGAEETVLQAIAQAGVEKVLYISCHPATQARDAAVLLGKGYAVAACQPVDMFCQTSGIENIMLFVKGGLTEG